MQLIALLILCLAAVSCDKKVVRSVDVPVEETLTEDEEALTEDVLAHAGLVCSGSLQLPTGTGLLAEELRVLSFYGEVTPNAAGKFNISMVESKKPQFVFATDPATDNALLVGYVDPAQGEHVNLSCESTAVSLAFLTPLMIGTTAEQRSEFISGIKAHPKFSLLVAAVKATFQADPQNVLNYTAHPELYEQAVEISVDVWQQMTAAGKLLAPAAAQENVCTENKEANVWIADGPGNDIVFCNPKMVIYVATITGLKDYINHNDDFFDYVHIAPKGSAITPTFGFNWGAAPEPTEYLLPIDGTHIDYHITRGYSFGADGNWSFNWQSVTNWDTNYGRASLLNITLGAYYVLDLFVSIPLGISIPNITNLSLESLGGLIPKEKTLDHLEEGTSTFDAIKSFVSTMLDVGVKVLKSLLMADLTLQQVETTKSILENTAKILKLYDFTNVTVPFFVDLFSAWPEFRGEFQHINGTKGKPKHRKEGIVTETFPIPGGQSMEFVWIEKGDFSMGSTGYDNDEEPIHRVKISEGFWLGMYEVTQGQWEAVMGDKPEEWGSRVQLHSLYPATNISWDHVQKFIDELNETAGDWKYRLPTEAEWEYACHASFPAAGFDWSFELMDIGDYVWYEENAGNEAHAVGMKEANPWGLHDMHGNVAEWVQDWYHLYNNSLSEEMSVDPQGPAEERTKRVIRGGSFDSPRDDTLTAARDSKYPSFTDDNVGFRLVRIKEPEPPEPLWEEETFALLGDAEMTMVRVEPGTFWMGEPNRDSNEQPRHQVTIGQAFWLGQHEVTQGQWYEVMGTMPWDGQDWAFKDSVAWYPTYPATYISWEDVQEFIARLNEEAGERRYRLPTEAEWEYACRAGTQTLWSSGNDLSDLADYGWYSASYGRYNANTAAYPQMVSLKRANAWGLHDMHGNVAEWVQDWYDPDYYNFSPVMDPQGPAWPFLDSHPRRVARGGSINDQSLTRSASRRYYSPATRDAAVGFRLLRLDEPEALQEPAAAPREQTFYPGGAEMAMRWIEPGAFEMGTSDEPDASPHEVEISKGFWMGTHEVTQGQWDAVMGGTDWTAPWAGQSHVQLNADYPATYVSWEDVQEFIARLNDEEGGRYYRLPTEAEWEYACRAGTTTRWSFGDDEDHLKYFAWYYFEDTPRSPTLKRANAWGLRGMHGNVREWVQDWYDEDYYANSPVLDPQGPLWPPFDAVHHRVTRGGGFNTFTAPTQSAFRLIAPPGSGSPFIGFRLVRDEVPQEVPTRTVSLPGGTSMGFVRVEPGVFQMGSPESEENRGSDETLHAVEISTGFWLGQYEVTQDQWYAVMETTPWDGAVNQVNPSYPATHISWEAVQAFIDRLNAAAGERRYRLPSEAEWEYACRAGMPTRWSFGDDERRLEHYAWYRDNASGVNEVGQKRPNFWGLYDMHGNVWEWVQDWYDADYYDSSPRVDPVGPDTGDERVSRGGVFANGPSFVRSALRRSFEPDPVFKKTFGFRLVMVDEPEEDPLEAVGELEPEEDLSTLSEAEARRSLDEQGISYSLDSFFERIVAGDVSSIELFIAAGMDLNAQDNDGYTALAMAVSGAALLGHVELVKIMEMVRLLVEHGADVNAQGGTALSAAAVLGYVEVARFLVEHGADVNAQNNDGGTALMAAAMFGRVEVARFLVEHGADVNAQDNDGGTALMRAVTIGGGRRVEMVRFLVEHGADVNAQDNDGGTALMYAKLSGNQEIIDLLEAAGATE